MCVKMINWENDKEDTQGSKILWILSILSFLLPEAVFFFAKKNVKNTLNHPGLQLSKNRTVEKWHYIGLMNLHV